MNHPFQIDFLDHVALRTKDPQALAEWYQTVLGLKKYTTEEWGDYPIFLLAGRSGLAIFPRRKPEMKAENPNYDHFAFNVDQENFLKAQAYLKSSGISFSFSDHTHFHSIYFRDPDNNIVELTTIVVDPDQFYQ